MKQQLQKRITEEFALRSTPLNTRLTYQRCINRFERHFAASAATLGRAEAGGQVDQTGCVAKPERGSLRPVRVARRGSGKACGPIGGTERIDSHPLKWTDLLTDTAASGFFAGEKLRRR